VWEDSLGKGIQCSHVDIPSSKASLLATGPDKQTPVGWRVMAAIALNLRRDVMREAGVCAWWTDKAERGADFNKSRISEV
jgi:hypothetical protein